MKKLTTVRAKQAVVVRQRKRHPNRPLTETNIRTLLHSIENIRDDVLIRLGLSVGLRVSEVVTIRTSEIDFERGLIKIWGEKKDSWRLVMPTLDSLEKTPSYLFLMSAKSYPRCCEVAPTRSSAIRHWSCTRRSIPSAKR